MLVTYITVTVIVLHNIEKNVESSGIDDIIII